MNANRVKLEDVARFSGVSLTSASMGLADSPRVAEATKERVRAAAKQLGYVPHAAARSLRSQKADTVAVVVPHDTRHVFSHPYFTSLLEGILLLANEEDVSVLLSTARTAADEVSAYTRIVRGERASGVIVAAAATTDVNVARLDQMGYPLVVVGRSPQHKGLVTVGLDDIGGAHAAVQHLIQVHGATRIGHVSGPLNHQSSLDKRDGYRVALREAGLEADPRLQFEGDHTEESGASAVHYLAPYLPDCDAIFFANDQMAIGAISELQSIGCRIPDDLLVVGYDDHPMLEYLHPSLTTIAGDTAELGIRAMRQLLELMNGHHDVSSVEIPTELIVRESCGCKCPESAS